MELLLNLIWLMIASALGVLVLASRTKSEAMFGKCVHTRSSAWVCYAILIALLLPAISMTDDMMAMVAPSDGEQIVRRYELSVGGQHHADLHVALFPILRDRPHSPLAFLANVETIPSFDVFTISPRQILQGRAPPSFRSIPTICS